MTDPLGLINTSGAGGVSPIGSRAPKVAGGEPTQSFKDVLMKNIEQVNKLQQDAEMAAEDVVSGKRDDLAGVLLAKQHADDAFRLLLQVRNKLMDAYEEIKQIRV